MPRRLKNRSKLSAELIESATAKIPQRPGRKWKPPTEEWEAVKRILFNLYMKQDKRLLDVDRLMQEEHNFHSR